jgi:guanylate kinase
VEWVEFLDYLQGTPVPTPPLGHDVVFEIDVHGAGQISERYDDAMLLFVVAPSDAAQELRLRGRGDPEEKVQARLAKAAEETAVASELGMQFVVNDDLERAISEIRQLIDDGRRSRRSQEHG